jgi:hypothetical protein
MAKRIVPPRFDAPLLLVLAAEEPGLLLLLQAASSGAPTAEAATPVPTMPRNCLRLG